MKGNKYLLNTVEENVQETQRESAKAQRQLEAAYRFETTIACCGFNIPRWIFYIALVFGFIGGSLALGLSFSDCSNLNKTWKNL